ncbi:hypothetical protein [Pseudomonas aeruginosa]|uniref:hypothetical protein n=1 Tax=Pseudomonas aeruginosa TaxID=287 RepID=UPI001042A472|nr:hypothetical protein [Pseudomonas aeruginosa]
MKDKIINKLRYASRLDIKTNLLLAVFSFVIGSVCAYVLGSSGNTLISNTVFQDILFVNMLLMYLNSAYVSYEIGKKDQH